MDTRHLVDPELLVGLERMPSFDFSREALPEIRAGLAEMLRQQSAAAPPSDVRVEELRIPGPVGRTRCPRIDLQPSRCVSPASGISPNPRRRLCPRQPRDE
jgi:hypothetical protein